MSTNKKLSATITIGGAISSSLRSAFVTVGGAMGKLGQSVQNLEKRQKMLGRAIQEFGRAGKDVDGLRNSYVRLTQQLDRTRQAQERLAKAQAAHAKLGGIGSKVSGAGAAVGAVGFSAGAALMPGIKEAKHLQSEVERVRALGFNAKDSSDILNFAKNHKAYGVSTVHKVETARDLAAAFGDTHHAMEALPLALKQRFALGLYDSEHGTNLLSNAAYSMAKVVEARNGTKNMEEYRKQANMSHQVLVATGGRVNGEELQHAIKTGGLAAKSLSDEAFYYGDSHLIQELQGDSYGTALMTLYQSLAQGRTTQRATRNLEKLGLIGDKSKVKHDKAGQISYMNPGALKGYDTFVSNQQEWVEKYFIPALRKHGIDPDDRNKVSQIAGMIVSARKGASFLADRTLQRDVIKKGAKNAMQSDNIEVSFERNKTTAAGKELDAESKLADLKMRIGNSILPTYIRALELTATALEKLNEFADKNPGLMKAITVGLGAVAIGATIAAPALLAVGGALHIMASLRLAAAVTSLKVFNGELLTTSAAAKTGGIGLMGFIGKLMLVGSAAMAALEVAHLLGLPDTDKKKGMDAVKRGDWLGASIYLPAGDFISEGWNAMTSSKPSSPSLPSTATPYGRSGPPGGGDTVHIGSMNIYQQPNEDSAAFARRIISEMNRQNGVQNRSVMFDGAVQ